MTKFIMIMGTNGSGKSTLVKNILLSDYVESEGDFLIDCFDFFVNSCKYGNYTISKGGKYCAVGSYYNKCGGADGIKSVDDYFEMIHYLMIKYPDKDICVEGVMNRSRDDLKFLFEELKSLNYDSYLILLEQPLSEAVKRVMKRSGKYPNEDSMQTKMTSFCNQFNYFKELNCIKCYNINTSNKTSDEVFNEFKNKIGE